MAANGEELTEGALSKWTNKLNGWQYRWFVLDSKGGYMSYYTVRHRSVLRTPTLGRIALFAQEFAAQFRLNSVQMLLFDGFVPDLVKYCQFAPFW